MRQKQCKHYENSVIQLVNQTCKFIKLEDGIIPMVYEIGINTLKLLTLV